MPPAPLVTLHVWGIGRGAVPRAVGHQASDRVRLWRTPGLRFAKLLGTGSGRTFTHRDADLLRWALLTVWDDGTAADAFDAGRLVGGWRRFAEEEWSVRLQPIASRGRWSGREPFGRPSPLPWQGPVAAITRARIALRRTLPFWRAVPPVSSDLHHAPGLLLALGIGEAPVGLQGTLSVWSSPAAINAFAYDRTAHVAVIERTARERWYAEELFARFGVLSSRGTLRGVDPLSGPPVAPG